MKWLLDLIEREAPGARIISVSDDLPPDPRRVTFPLTVRPVLSPCDGCREDRPDVRAVGRDAEGDADGPDLCGECRGDLAEDERTDRAEAERESHEEEEGHCR